MIRLTINKGLYRFLTGKSKNPSADFTDFTDFSKPNLRNLPAPTAHRPGAPSGVRVRNLWINPARNGRTELTKKAPNDPM
jgi:hypothetical protein